MKCFSLVVCLVSFIPVLRADNIPVGTWVRRPTNDGVSATLIIEAAGTGRKLTFKVAVHDGGTVTMVATTLLDGKDAVVSIDGKPSGETMAIRMVDDHHAINVLKMDGKPMATQKSEISADGKVIKVVSDPAVPGVPQSIEYWDKK